MTSTWHAAAETLVSDLQHVFAGRLRSVVAYGPHIEGVDEAPLTCLALVESLSVSDLEACAGVEAEWERRRLATPLLLPEDEFRRSLDAFPLEYGEIIRVHARVFGADPFDGVTIPREDLRRACETQAKSHLVHLREGFIEAGNRPQRIADLVTASAPAFAALLRHVAHLAGAPASSRSDATLAGARAAGITEGVVRDVLALERASNLPTADAARLFPPYLTAVEQLARTIDTWRA
jgi:hypothetical protein